MLLCIETSGKNCSVALFEGLQLVSIREVHTEQFSHSENLHVFIEQVLKESNLHPTSIYHRNNIFNICKFISYLFG